MAIIKYYLGAEKHEIKEVEGFEYSIFGEQYAQAIKQIAHLLKSPMDDAPNLLAFCGDRGEGKSSCMRSVSYIIENVGEKKEIKEYVSKITNEDLSRYHFDVLPIIDPAFFDKNHNVLELVLGQLYSNFKEWVNKNGSNEGFMSRNKVAKCFQEAKLCLRYLNKGQEEMYDPLEELESLSAGVKLKSCIATLIKEYLGLVGKDMLIIRIDDLDLNMTQAYKMCEEIRKYLNNKHCLILISLKAEQLIEAIENSIHQEASYPEAINFSNMAEKYVTKLIPMSCRVHMPKVYDLCDEKLEVYLSYKDEAPCFMSDHVKVGVVRKIFNTSRFLFYNSKGSVSRIVPNNLRGLAQLLGLLFSMDDYDGEDVNTLRRNKLLFKSYFFKSWVKQLNSKNQLFIERLLDIEDNVEVNKFVVNHLSSSLTDVDDLILKGIRDTSNYNYNISVGDVLYFITYLEQNSVDEELKLVLFFIKSYYSIRLYESYDVITDAADNLYPTEKTEGQLYKVEAWFRNTNVLQRLVAGNMFTYTPGSLLPSIRRADQARDYKVIRGIGAGLSTLFRHLGGLMSKYEELNAEEKEMFEVRFRMAEFFALTVSRSIYERMTSGYSKLDRKNSIPYYLSPFNLNTGYYVFDIMLPFNTLINVRYAYERFKDLANIYPFAEQHEWSLLSRMIAVVLDKDVKEGRYKEEDISALSKEKKMNRLLSNAVIRNAEVAEAVMEQAKSRRYVYRNYKGTAELLSFFYDNIRKSGMMTYNRSENETPYYIDFEYLEPIVELLRDERIHTTYKIGEGADEKVLPSFDDIFDLVTDYKEDVNSMDIRKLFSPFLKVYKGRHDRSWILEKIKEKMPAHFNALSTDIWNEVFTEGKTYSKTDIINALIPYYNDVNEGLTEVGVRGVDNKVEEVQEVTDAIEAATEVLSAQVPNIEVASAENKEDITVETEEPSTTDETVLEESSESPQEEI